MPPTFSDALVTDLPNLQTPTGEGTAPPETPPLHSSQYLSPTFNLTPTPLLTTPEPARGGQYQNAKPSEPPLKRVQTFATAAITLR